MRLKYGQSEGFTFRSLFSRRSNKGSKSKSAPASFDNANGYPSPSRTHRAKPALQAKELEILGLVTDPRKESPPRSWYSPSETEPTLDDPAAVSHTPFLYPFDQPHDEHSDQNSDQETMSSRRRHESMPPTPLLPPPPSLSLPPQQPLDGPGNLHSQTPSEPTTDIGAPLSPALSYRTYASSGIFPWGSQPNVVDDGLSDDQVLVLPSPPKFTRSYWYRS